MIVLPSTVQDRLLLEGVLMEVRDVLGQVRWSSN